MVSEYPFHGELTYIFEQTVMAERTSGRESTDLLADKEWGKGQQGA